jgi:hypothetical protein
MTAATTLTGKPPLDFKPTTPEEMAWCMSDPMWRICSGALYKILVKSDDGGGDDGLVLPFIPNAAQRQLLNGLHYRNIILKARQLGFTTLIVVVFLDATLFGVRNTRAGIVAHTDDAAKAIFRDKVKFAYLNLPDDLRTLMPLARDSADELLFAHNNSSIRVSTSMRSGTLQFLHVSEFGKICAKFPQRADEVVTGSIPALAGDGMLFIESTAEGRDGHFFKMCERSQQVNALGRPLTAKEYKFNFFAWWKAREYTVNPDGVTISRQEHEYFDQIEAENGCVITPGQRAWWIETRDNDFSGQDEKMWQEYPSTPKEAFQQSAAGCYYAIQMTAARKQGRIGRVPHTDGYPVFSFWDIGNSDGTAVWLVQPVGNEYRAVAFFEGWGEPYAHFVKQLTDWAAQHGAIYGGHYLPHDGAHERQGMDNNHSPRQMLEQLGLRNVEIVDRVNELQYGIQATRDLLGQCRFDEQACKEGIAHLDQYKKRWNATVGAWADTPLKDEHTEAADAFRQLAQAIGQGSIGRSRQQRPNRVNRSGRVV